MVCTSLETECQFSLGNSFLIIGFIFLVVTFETDYIVLGTFTVVTLFPIVLGIYYRNIWIVLIMLVSTFVIMYKHRKNIVNIINKKEIGLYAGVTGKHRM